MTNLGQHLTEIWQTSNSPLRDVDKKDQQRQWYSYDGQRKFIAEENEG